MRVVAVANQLYPMFHRVGPVEAATELVLGPGLIQSPGLPTLAAEAVLAQWVAAVAALMVGPVLSSFATQAVKLLPGAQ